MSDRSYATKSIDSKMTCDEWVNHHLNIFRGFSSVIPAHVRLPTEIELKEKFEPGYGWYHHMTPQGLTLLDLKGLLLKCRGVELFTASGSDVTYALESIPTTFRVIHHDFEIITYYRSGRISTAKLIDDYFQEGSRKIYRLTSVEDVLTLMLMLGGDVFVPLNDQVSAGSDVICRNKIKWKTYSDDSESKVSHKKKQTSRAIVYCRGLCDRSREATSCVWAIAGIMGLSQRGQKAGGCIILPQ